MHFKTGSEEHIMSDDLREAMNEVLCDELAAALSGGSLIAWDN